MVLECKTDALKMPYLKLKNRAIKKANVVNLLKVAREWKVGLEIQKENLKK